MKIAIVVGSMLISICLGAVYHELPNPNATKGKCLSYSYPELGELEYGEAKNVPQECTLISCDKNGITEASCGAVDVPPGCTLEDPDLEKEYPECCPTKCKC